MRGEILICLINLIIEQIINVMTECRMTVSGLLLKINEYKLFYTILILLQLRNQ